MARPFLQWLAAPPGQQWLDVGCGTGVFTQMVLDHGDVSSVAAIDSSAAQVAFARRHVDDRRAEFRVADVQSLPFCEGSFDVVCSALVLNFVADRVGALCEMRRVARPGGRIAAYVWDFEAERSPSGPLRAAMSMTGLAVPPVPGSAASTMSALSSLFLSAGLEGVATHRIEATVVFRDFHEYWQSQTPSYSPTTRIISGLASQQRRALVKALEDALPSAEHGKIHCTARANAVRAHVP